MRLPILRLSVALALSLLFVSNVAMSQSRDLGAQRLLLDDGNGHFIRLSVPSTGWPGPGIFDWVLPIPPTGVDAGFVEKGNAVDLFLQWNDALQYWEAVPSLFGTTGTGTMNYIAK